MADPLGASPIDGQDSIPFLDSPVPICQASSDHLVHLKEDSFSHHSTHAGNKIAKIKGKIKFVHATEYEEVDE